MTDVIIAPFSTFIVFSAAVSNMAEREVLAESISHEIDRAIALHLFKDSPQFVKWRLSLTVRSSASDMVSGAAALLVFRTQWW